LAIRLKFKFINGKSDKLFDYTNLANNFADLRLKTHIQHPISFVQNKESASTHIGCIAFKEIKDAARSGHANIDTFILNCWYYYSIGIAVVENANLYANHLPGLLLERHHSNKLIPIALSCNILVQPLPLEWPIHELEASQGLKDLHPDDAVVDSEYGRWLAK
jgi:hypothetical protein